MKRSRVFLLFDLVLFAVLVLPLGIAVAVTTGRAETATVYEVTLAVLLMTTFVTARISQVSLRDYLRAVGS
jgi:hypothetical protein